MTKVEVAIRPWGGGDGEVAGLAAWPPVPQVDLDRLRQARPVPGRSTQAAWVQGLLAGVAVVDEGADGACEITIAVRPDLRRVGIGSRLLARVRHLCSDRRLLAVVARDNAVAIAFFTRHGFRRQPSLAEGFIHLVRAADGAAGQEQDGDRAR